MKKQSSPTLLLSQAAYALLEQLGIPDAELTYSSGEWWTETRRWGARSVNQLLQFCLIRCDYGEGSEYQVYTINEEGRALLRNPKYRPQIITALTQLAAAHCASDPFDPQK